MHPGRVGHELVGPPILPVEPGQAGGVRHAEVLQQVLAQERRLDRQLQRAARVRPPAGLLALVHLETARRVQGQQGLAHELAGVADGLAEDVADALARRPPVLRVEELQRCFQPVVHRVRHALATHGRSPFVDAQPRLVVVAPRLLAPLSLKQRHDTPPQGPVAGAIDAPARRIL